MEELVSLGSHLCLGGGFKHFLFSPLLEEDSHFDEYVSTGLVQPPTRCDGYVNIYRSGELTYPGYKGCWVPFRFSSSLVGY